MKKLSTLLVIAAIAGLLFFAWWNNGTSPVDRKDATTKSFVIPRGQGLREIANRLKTAGLIKDSIVFFLLVKQQNLDTKIQAGDYFLSPAMDALTTAKTLTKGSVDIWITIPEGKRADEVADILSKNLPTFEDSWREVLQQYEGYLFPDTYLIPRTATVDLVISLLRGTFDERFATIQNVSGKSKGEIVVIASLIEREAKHDKDRPIVSSVIYNRLGLDMPLQIDATVQYALGYQGFDKSWWKRELTYADLQIQSAYNTYKNTGLPPSPIANPGLKSLSAAANPDDTNYLYYLSDKEGNNHYAKTLEEHNTNIRRYGL